MAFKIRDYSQYRDYITNYDLANLFYVYDDKRISSTAVTYNINRIIQFTGMAKADRGEFLYYEVLKGDTWNLISYKHYNTTSLWWLVCMINNVFNPTVEPTAGSVIRIMPEATVNSILEEIRDT